MQVTTIKGINFPVYTYSFLSCVRADAPVEFLPVLAGGFFTTNINEEVIEKDNFLLTDSQKKVLRDHNGPVIFLEDSIKDEYPIEELMGILYHEQAHILNGDVDSKEAPTLDHEIAADKYAVRRVGSRTMVRALIRSAFLIAQRRFGETPYASKMAKLLLKEGAIAQRIKALN